MLSDIMLSIVMLNVANNLFMPSVFMLNGCSAAYSTTELITTVKSFTVRAGRVSAS